MAVTFQTSHFGSLNGPFRIATADVNGDGKVDLQVINDGSNNVSVFLGNGDGTFLQEQQTYATGSIPHGIATADVNGDGKPDLLVANRDSNNVSVLLGVGNGTFQAQQTYAAGAAPWGIATADVNGDGKVDLLVTNEDPNTGNTVSVFLGNGDGTFQAPQTYATGSNPHGIATADVNGDGKPDLLVANLNVGGPSAVSVLLGNGDGTFQAQKFYAAGAGPDGIAVADVNGDGKPDLLVANHSDNTVSVLLGNGDGTFQAQHTYATGSFPTYPAVADVNGDGKPDLLVTNQNSDTLSVFLGNGDGTFQAPQNFATGSTPTGIAIADVNGDGRPDIVVADAGSNDLTLLLNTPPDDDSAEQDALKLTVNNNSTTPIGATNAGSVPFTIAGLDPEDTGSVTFSDGTAAHDVVVNIVNGAPTATSVSLSGMNDGTIKSSLAVNTDPAGNKFTAVSGNPVTLDQDKVAEAPMPPTAPSSLMVPAGGSKPMGITASPVDSDDLLSVTISGVPAFESITAPSGYTVTRSGNGKDPKGDTFTIAETAGTAGQPISGLMLKSTFTGKGHPVNPFTVTASNTTAGETGTSAAITITVTDPPASAPSGLSSSSLSLSDLMSQFGAGDGSSPHHGFAPSTTFSSSSPTSNLAALIESHTASPFAALSGGAAGLLSNPLTYSDQKAFLTHSSHG
jgi:hypothetical protein